jgi:signal peptidase I
MPPYVWYFAFMVRYFDTVQRITERYLTKRKKRLELEKAARAVKRTFKGELLGWLDAIVFAVVFVLLVNQFLFQLFLIPTPSMVATLLVKDRVFVSKTSYGIELYPGGPKVLDSKEPLRDDVIVFYNPMYESRGPVFDILSQIIYYGTFSLVNIDKDEDGNMRERLYVKRAALTGGESAVIENGKVFITADGLTHPFDEQEFRTATGQSIAPHQSLQPSLYSGFRAFGALLAYQEAGFIDLAPHILKQEYAQIESYRDVVDYYQVDKVQAQTLKQIDPSSMTLRGDFSRYEVGRYTPHGYILPLGDNRDNSQDGRYFGPVSTKKIIGSVKFRFWPLSRIGIVR